MVDTKLGPEDCLGPSKFTTGLHHKDVRMSNASFPPYTYVPGGPHPHPTSSPLGHSFGQSNKEVLLITNHHWESSPVYLRGIQLFNAGYYWEAHEAWEALWHAHGRRGTLADLFKALIKLAAAGVKVREHQPHGIKTHARRAADLLETARAEGGNDQLGLDLTSLAQQARQIADHPPENPIATDAPASPVLGIQLIAS